MLRAPPSRPSRRSPPPRRRAPRPPASTRVATLRRGRAAGRSRCRWTAWRRAPTGGGSASRSSSIAGGSGRGRRWGRCWTSRAGRASRAPPAAPPTWSSIARSWRGATSCSWTCGAPADRRSAARPSGHDRALPAARRELRARAGRRGRPLRHARGRRRPGRRAGRAAHRPGGSLRRLLRLLRGAGLRGAPRRPPALAGARRHLPAAGDRPRAGGPGRGHAARAAPGVRAAPGLRGPQPGSGRAGGRAGRRGPPAAHHGRGRGRRGRAPPRSDRRGDRDDRAPGRLRRTSRSTATWWRRSTPCAAATARLCCASRPRRASIRRRARRATTRRPSTWR